MFEEEFEALVARQKKEARGQRREMLEKDLSATKKMLEVLYPLIGSLKDIILEYEIVKSSGVKIYADAFIRKLRIVLEEENFVTHAETITRKRFSFERSRVRTISIFGYTFFTYSRDELDQQPEQCRRDFLEFISSRTNIKGIELLQLPVFEREILRFALLQDSPFGLAELSSHLQLHPNACSRLAKLLVTEGLLGKIGGGEHRCHQFQISEKGISMFHPKLPHSF
ncbi:hypothetical protein [Cohnella soli]|uniref:MarR family transcriptional regulator n=1 Tax=Cohnella soli TaxID=425005 RepID=A0ABW0I2D6_9BACL